jgi:eukaryotic-like serine/threonine-protein kinase
MPQRARDYQPGESLPGTVYQVVRLIGAGGMGTVYDVVDMTIGKHYVLKTLHSQLGERQDLARRMLKEARNLARLNHPNIVEVITAGVTGDELRLPYYVMERLNGQSLRVVLEKKGQLELPHACHIGIDLLDALDHAHDRGVIHRDVKPDNIFLHRTSAGMTVTKLLDFGILSRLDATVRETAGRFLGTLRYAAPEQLRGERPTQKMDLYAAGLVLYEMIAGRGPFDEEGDPHAIGAAHMDKPPPLLSRFVAVPRELEALVMAALAKAPEARPRDAFSFAASLRTHKRALSGAQPRESTEDRATAAAVLEPELAIAPYVEVRQPLPEGPYVISPARERPSPTQTSFPTTTLHGITPPTLGPSLADPATSTPTATTPEAVDRMARTNSLAPDTVASPQHGTEAFALAFRPRQTPDHLAPPSNPSSVDSPFQWPGERASAASEEPQVQTLSAILPRSRSIVRMVAATAMLLLVATAGVLMLFGRHANLQRPRGDGVRPQAITAMAAPSSIQEVASTRAAPVLSPPAAVLDEGGVASNTMKSPAVPIGLPTHGKARPLGTAASKPGAPPGALFGSGVRMDRPGPGF